MAPLVVTLAQEQAIEAKVCNSSAQRDARPSFDLFAIKPDYDLDIMRSG